MLPKDAHAARLLVDLEANQGAIRRIREAWERLPDELFEGRAAKNTFFAEAARKGHFKNLVRGLNDPSAFGLAAVESHQGLRHLPNYRSILSAWFGQLKPGKDWVAQFSCPENLIRSTNKTTFLQKSINSGMQEPLLKAFENVKKQKEAIIPLFASGDLAKARKYVDELVESQLHSGGSKFAAMSLCDLAQHAKTVLNYSLQLELARHAVELCPEDGWAQGQHGDAATFA